MSEMFCTYPGDRDEALVAYLYEEDRNGTGGAERAAFESHLAACAACQQELVELGVVRRQLARWQPPAVPRLEPQAAQAADVERRDARPASGGGHRWQGWQDVPAWAQVAAALLILGVAAGAANLNVRYDRDGLSVRTGWLTSSPPAETPPAAAPWRGDLASLEQQLRAEIRTSGDQARTSTTSTPIPAAGGAAADAETLRRVKALVDASERRQERELALRVAEVSRDVQAQRQADLVKIDRSLGLLQNNTGFEVMRQRELLNSLAVKVSQTR
jgi:hypothetical protein